MSFDDLQWLEPIDKRIRDVEAETRAIRALNQLYKDNDNAMRTLATMRPKIRVILDRAIEEGVRRGYRRAFKHVENPSEEHILNTIEECVMSSVYDYFSFDDECQPYEG